MTDHDTITRAYLFLAALEKSGIKLMTFDIHLAWIAYCRDNNIPAAEDIIVAARLSRPSKRSSECDL